MKTSVNIPMNTFLPYVLYATLYNFIYKVRMAITREIDDIAWWK